MRLSLTSIALVLTIGLWAAPASAVVIVGDSFEIYATGALAGRNGGLVATGSWTSPYSAISTITVVNGGLSYLNGAIDIQGGAQSASVGSGNSDTALSRSIDPQTGALYFSLLLRPENGLDSNDFIQFLLNDDTDLNNAGSFGFRNMAGNLFFARTQNSTAATMDSAIGAADDTTFLLVGKLSKASSSNYDRFDLFVNPSTLIEPLPSATQSGSIGTGITIDFFTMRTVTLDSGDRFDFDALRIGTTYLDVVGLMPATVVPEPSSLVVFGTLLGLPLLRRLRRRKT
jgi:hypothetical protein